MDSLYTLNMAVPFAEYLCVLNAESAFSRCVRRLAADAARAVRRRPEGDDLEVRPDDLGAAGGAGASERAGGGPEGRSHRRPEGRGHRRPHDRIDAGEHPSDVQSGNWGSRR